MTCYTELSSSLNSSCLASAKGYEQVAYIGKWSDIATKTVDSTDTLITALTLATGKQTQAVTIRGEQPYTGTTSTQENKTYGAKWNKDVMLTLHGDSVENSEAIQALGNEKWFVILQQTGVSGDTNKHKYAIFGIESGAKSTASAMDVYGDNAGWTVTLSEKLADYPSLFLWDTDEATTDALIATLNAPAA